MKTIYKGMVCLLLTLPVILNSQRVAFVGISYDAPDDFSFVAVPDIPPNTNIFFTDEEYRAVCGGFHFADNFLFFHDSAFILKLISWFFMIPHSF